MMIDFLEEIDRQIVVAVNSWNTPFLDEVMWWISARITWVPLYFFLVYLAYKKLDKRTFFLFIGFVIATVAITDLVSVNAFKNVFLRYRPSHNLLITNQLHYYEIKPGEFYQGGQYGFVSSHAANYLAIATSVLLVLNTYYSKLKWLLLFFGVLICYSRIYLGVHYLSDVLVGALVGSVIALLLYKVAFQPLKKKIIACTQTT